MMDRTTLRVDGARGGSGTLMSSGTGLMYDTRYSFLYINCYEFRGKMIKVAELIQTSDSLLDYLKSVLLGLFPKSFQGE